MPVAYTYERTVQAFHVGVFDQHITSEQSL
jgi:hypothetical protein